MNPPLVAPFTARSTNAQEIEHLPVDHTHVVPADPAFARHL
ncbi:hypothetical protein ACIF70_27410 [Actinacidiphila glaucinigra]|nr:hypothetical protein [Actinacidiphila glaucinigra]WSD57925.1 hypothetical protein OIE69_02925 [Actinacidiphila glaucinigra]